MRALWLFIKFLMLAAVVMMGAVFAMHNSQQISVDLIFMQGAQASVGLWLILFLALGAALGLFASSVLIASYRRKLALASKKD